MAGGCDLCTGTATLKGSGELQAFDGLVRGSDASQHRLPSLRVLPLPRLVLGPSVSEYRAPSGQGQGLTCPTPVLTLTMSLRESAAGRLPPPP